MTIGIQLVEDLVERLSKRLMTKEPAAKGLRLAAVSLVLRNGKNPQVLLIKRAEREGDPWSGQIAFPGGKMQPDDGTLREAAAREAWEEVGIDLRHGARFLGYGEPTPTHMGEMEVFPCVFRLTQDVVVIPNGEVASYRWVGLEELVSPKVMATYRLVSEGRDLELPALALGDYLVWGLTHRVITSLLL